MTVQTNVDETVDPAEQARAELARAGVNLGSGLAATTAAHLLEAVAGAPGAVVALTKMVVGWGRNIVILATVLIIVLTGFAMFFSLGRALLIGMFLAWLTSRVSQQFGWLVKFLVGATLFVLAWTALSPIAMPIIDYGLSVVERVSPETRYILAGAKPLQSNVGTSPTYTNIPERATIIDGQTLDLPSSLTVEQAAAFEREDVRVYVPEHGWKVFRFSDIHDVIELPGNATQVATAPGFAVAGLSNPDDPGSEVWRAQNGEDKILDGPWTRWVVLKPYP